MKHTNYLILLIALITLKKTIAQERVEPCITQTLFEESIKNNPEFAKNLEILEAEYKTNDPTKNKYTKLANAIKIIPVVFHIIHQYGTERIEESQCLDQIRILNEDFRRQNPDTVDTPQPFKVLGADCGIEFRLAQIDPNGNCTNGINYVYSAMTNGARNNVKSLIYWPRDKYLNIWVVRYITSGQASSKGYVIGFAQFPGDPSDTTDGVVVRYDFVGNIGAANSSKGRTATHEVGHWLNLRHIWGDDNGACYGSDGVSDTPNQGSENFSTCPSFPHISCNNGPDGDLYSNYMDYTDAACQNIFTNGQSDRMNKTLASNISDRNKLWSPSNLIATGVNNVPALCKPVADFVPHTPFYICAGQSIKIFDNSWGGAQTKRKWVLSGATIQTDTVKNPVVIYSKPGKYSIKLIASNNVGTDSIQKENVVYVLPSNAENQSTISQGFELDNLENDWTVINYEPSSSSFERVNNVSYSGSYSCKLSVFSNTLPNDVDELISPTINLKNYTSPKLVFKQAYAQTSNSDATENKLSIFISSNCGKSWNQLSTPLTGTSLATASENNSEFIPTITEWKERTISLANYSKLTNVRFMFRFTGASSGNNFYLDDINISSTNTGIEDVNADIENLIIAPNPVNNECFAIFNLIENSNVTITIYNSIGELVLTKSVGKLTQGAHKLDLINSKNEFSKGVYFVKLISDKNQFTRKLIIE